MSLKEDVQEAFVNLGQLSRRIPLDEGRRLDMLLRVISAYIAHLESRNDEDDDGRC